MNQKTISNRIPVTDFEAPELDVYARMNEIQLLNRHEPEKGMFIAESPKVIGRALDAGYIPVSALVEKHQMEENEETRQILERFESTDVPIFTAEFEVLTKMTGFKLTRGMLCALKRQPLMDYRNMCDYTVKIPMAHGVDSLNVAAASAVAFWQLGKK